jgi:hypothetical protein
MNLLDKIAALSLCAGVKMPIGHRKSNGPLLKTINSKVRKDKKRKRKMAEKSRRRNRKRR